MTATPTLNQPISPLGIRMCVGLLAPFMDNRGQIEIENVYGVSASDLYSQAVFAAQKLDALDHAAGALAMFFRGRPAPADAARKLGEFCQTLPNGLAEAQSMLDGWTAENTLGLITTAPINVRDDTEFVAASAVAVDAPWVNKAYQGGEDMFVLTMPDGPGWVTSDDNGFLAVGELAGGLEARFAASAYGDETSLALLTRDRQTLQPADATSSWVVAEEVSASYGAELPVVWLPQFRQEASHNLMDDPGRWGLESAAARGLPALNALISAAVQDVLVEITHTGVKAAAVTMVSMTRGMAPTNKVERLRANLTGGNLAYGVFAQGVAEPIVTGIYMP